MSTGKTITDMATLLLSDADNVRWTLTELIGWVNAGVEQIILAKPSASSQSVEVDLVEGTRQTVPTTGTPTPLRILDFERNVTTTGNVSTQGHIITPVGRNILDAEEPNWHDKRIIRFRKEVRHCIFDENNPLQFYCFPGNDGTGKIAALMSVLPAAVTVAGYEADVTGLNKLYDQPLVDYVLSRAFLKDDLASNPARSTYHTQLFAAAIGIKIQIEGATSPNKRRAGS